MTRWVIEADGGSRGNPGPAGYGAVVREAGSDDVLVEVAESIGTATNNVAEYRGLIAGLAAAARLSGGEQHAADIELQVRLDSKLVVEQMNGRWKIKHPDLQPLASRVARAASTFQSVSYDWIPRARNAHADRLANEAMDAAAEGRPWSHQSRPGGEEPTAAPDGGAGEQGSAGEQDLPASSAGDAAASPSQRRATGWMAPSTSPTTMIVFRHGETPLSVEKRFSGIGEAELTSRGRSQARAAAERMRARAEADMIVSSPLARARETAEILSKALDVPVTEDQRLRETDFGAWEGRTFSEIRQQWPDALAAWLADPEVAPPQGESFAVVAERVGAFRSALVERYPQRAILVVSHVTPMKMLASQALLAPMAALYRMHLDVASVCEIDWYADGPAVVRSLNDTSHLT